MKEETQTKDEDAMTLVGMDLHSEKVQLSITTWRHGSDPVPLRSIVTTVGALERTYRRQVPAGALTVLEASSNSFSVARRLLALKYDTKVLRSDIAASMSAKDRVNDRIDAYNIAVAYARRGAGTDVFIPSPQFHEYREIWFAYRNATKDVTRLRNRIWGFCNRHGLDGLGRSRTRRPDRIRRRVEELGWSEEQTFQLETMLRQLEFAESMKERCAGRIEQIVAGDAQMRRAMSVLGIGHVNAFALVAFVEKAERFGNPKKLVRYVGLNPSVCSSGKSDGRHGLAGFGRRDLRALLVEAANSAMKYGKGPIHRWARRKAASGKPRNLVVCALARKMLVALWHALMGHPTPSREAEDCFRRKLALLAGHVGKARIRAMGFSGTSDYVNTVADSLTSTPSPIHFTHICLHNHGK